jgi:hypothetical protein
MGGQGSGVFSTGPLVSRLLNLQLARAAIPSPVKFFIDSSSQNLQREVLFIPFLLRLSKVVSLL